MKTSLAQFIFEARAKLGFSQSGLAKKANLPLSTIEAIESAQELFLPTTVRQKLAKALRLNGSDIKLFEKEYNDNLPLEEIVEALKKQLVEEEKDLKCPQCGMDLLFHVEKMYDLEDNLIRHPKARCSKCPFQIR